MSLLRLVSFHCGKNHTVRVGALAGSAVVDLTQYTNALKGYLPPPQSYVNTNGAAAREMLSLIDAGEDAAKWLHQVVKSAEASPESVSSALISLKDVTLSAPIPTPRRNLMCVGKNYKDHIAEVAAADKDRGIGTTSSPAASTEAPKYAQFFTKATTTVIGPHGKVESHPTITKWLDYEAELAVIIGKAGRDISRDNAMKHVFGFSIANDITSRDVQRHHNQWFRGKSLDTTCPMGPCIVHRLSDIDPFNLSIKLWLNNEKRQDSNTNNMIFDIPEIIRQLSAGLTLLPGDIILTGTPQGVGYAMKPPQVLKAGDHCAIEIEKIGRLENTVI